jgi:hypothetical protein
MIKLPLFDCNSFMLSFLDLFWIGCFSHTSSSDSLLFVLQFLVDYLFWTYFGFDVFLHNSTFLLPVSPLFVLQSLVYLNDD